MVGSERKVSVEREVSAEKKAMIQELHHQLYYTNPGSERDEVRRQLEYWIYYSRRF